MAVTARFSANFDDFVSAVAKAQVTLKGFQTDASTVERRLATMADGFNGRKIIDEATLMVKALGGVSGIVGLTDKELARVGATAEEAIQKLERMGKTVPKELLGIAGAAKASAAEVDKMGSSWSNFGKEMLAVAGGFLTAQAIFAGVKTVFHALSEEFKLLTIHGAAVGDVGEAFDRLTEQSGHLGSALLGTLRAGTHATVADFELMKTVNQDLAAGMNLTDKQFGVLSKGAFALAQATGGDVKTALDTMNDAMLTGRTRALALLTGKINLKGAEEDFAKTLGTTADRLTEEGKLEAARISILKAVGEATDRLGDQTDGLDERVAQATVSWTNFQDQLGRTIATSTTIQAALDGIRDALIATFGGSTDALIKTIADTVDDLAISLVDVAQAGISSAGFLVKEWIAVQKLFGDTVQIIDGVRLAFLYFNLEVGKARAVTTGIFDKTLQGQIDATDAKIQKLLESMKARGDQLQVDDQRQASVDATTAKYNTTLDDLRVKMQKARDESRNFVGPMRGIADAEDQASEAGKRHQFVLQQTDKDLKKTESDAKKLREELEKHTESALKVEAGFAGLTTSVSAASDAELVFMRSYVAGTAAMASAERVLSSTNFGMAELGDQLEKVGHKVNDLGPDIAHQFVGPMKEAEKIAVSFADKLQNTLGKSLSSLNDIFQKAFEGGGGISGAIKSFATNALEGVLSLIPEVGPAISQFAGAIVAGFSKMFKGVSAEEKKARADIQSFEKQLESLLTTTQKAEAGGKQWAMTTIAVRDAYLQTGRSAAEAEAAVIKLWGSSKLGAEEAKKAMDEINAVLDEQKQDAADLEAAVQRYGFTIEELGPAMQRQKLDEQAQQLLNDWRLLVGSGIDLSLVNERMADTVQDYLTLALKTGQEVPIAMKPILQSMIDQGTFVDKNGVAITDLGMAGIKFSETMTQGFDKIVKKLQELLDKIGMVPAAINAIPTTREIQVNVNYNDPGFQGGGGRDMNFAARGGLVTASGVQYLGGGGNVLPFRPRGTDTVPAMLTPGERVLSVGQNTDYEGTTARVAALHSEVIGLRRDMKKRDMMMPKLFAAAVARKQAS